MPDRHDPKLSIRPPGERKPDQRPDERKNDDPLVELARVVSNRSSSTGTPAKTEAPIGASNPSVRPGGAPLPSESDLARDLEEELLNELQASFSMVPEVVGQAAAQMPAAPPPTVIADEPASESVEEPTEPTEPPVPPEAASRQQPEESGVSFHPATKVPVDESQAGESFYDDILNDLLNLTPESNGAPEPQPEPPALAPQSQQAQQSPVAAPRPRQAQPQQDVKGEEEPSARIKPPPSAATKRESLASRIARAAQNGEREEPKTQRSRPQAPRPPAPTQRPTAVRPSPPAERRRHTDIDEFLPPNVSPVPSEPAARPPRQVESRWDLPLEREAEPAFDPSRFAPLPSDSFQPEEHGGPQEVDIPADDLFFASGEGTFFEEPAAEEQLEAVPGYGDEGLPAYSDDDLAAMQPQRSRRVPLAIAALLGVLVIGGVAVIMLRSGGSSGPPQIIVADATPTKITPENAGTGDGDSQSKLIYDRVDANSEIADSQLVVADNDPIADIPPIPEDTASSDVSRVILGGGPAVDRPEEAGSMDSPSMSTPAGGGTTVASSPREPATIGPKKVRTVVVRPDGTIVSSEAVAPEEEQAATPQEDISGTLAELPPASETPPAPRADENPLLSDNFGAEAIDNPTPDAPVPDTPIEESASIPDIAPPAPRPPPASRPAASAPTVVATPGSANGPIDVTPGNTSQSASGGLGGGFLVQVSSQRSEATALQTFNELQRRYPSILGDRAPNIQRADLGERGIYYRVRVGYPTREQAVRMCENLKAAGGDCLLATR